MVRKPGFRRWRRLHRLVYLTGVFTVIHFLWCEKVPGREQLAYAGVLAGSLAVRPAVFLRRRQAPTLTDQERP